MSHPTQAIPRSRARLGTILLAALLALLAWYTIRALGGMALALRYPYELDYGEGIVWQQAALIPGPRMYGNSETLPFIVFHYPPVYYLAVRAALLLQSDFLVAGRLVSAASAVLLAPIVAATVLVITRRPNLPASPRDIAIAVMAGLLALCVHAVPLWGMRMRVDMLAITLSMLGLLVGVWANGKFLGTTCALLICVASVYTKQTQIPTGIAVFLIALMRNPRGALGAAAIAGAVGLAALGLMQELTDGGFLRNIVGYNINRIVLLQAYFALWPEKKSFPLFALMFVALATSAIMLFPTLSLRRPGAVLRQLWAFRQADRHTAAHATVFVAAALATVTLLAVFKSGSASNYVIQWFALCAILAGVQMTALAHADDHGSRAFQIVALALIAAVAVQPLESFQGVMTARSLDQQEKIVQRIAAAKKPVASENMVVVMRAGKPLMFEPVIITELASMGRWDETPLIEMIRSHQFEFIVTSDNKPGPGALRTPSFDRAMREAYPVVEQVASDTWFNLPAR